MYHHQLVSKVTQQSKKKKIQLNMCQFVCWVSHYKEEMNKKKKQHSYITYEGSWEEGGWQRTVIGQTWGLDTSTVHLWTTLTLHRGLNKWMKNTNQSTNQSTNHSTNQSIKKIL